MFVPVDPDHLFGKIGITVHVLAPERNFRRKLFARLLYGKTEAGQNFVHFLFGNFDPEKRVDLCVFRFDDFGNGLFFRAVGTVRSDFTCAELFDEVQRPV